MNLERDADVWSGRCYVLGGVFLVVLCFESAMRVWVFFFR